ncbi:MAG: extracellular solute-binding protein [Chloroflexi bacterium]|nr:extracellular solute-binding protein [Chloroflexota bacterium]
MVRHTKDENETPRRVSRRQVLLALTASAAALVAAGCAPAAAPSPTVAPKPAATTAPAPVATAAPAPAATQAPAQSGAAKPFAGVQLNVACFPVGYTNNIKDYFPEFEQQTGMKINYDLLAFAVYNQRADVELSTKGSAWDVMNITYIYSMKWIGAGWFTNLEDYIKDANKTPKDWGADDFSSGAIAPMTDDKGARFGFPFMAGTYAAGWARPDLVEKAGLKLPTTLDEMMKVMAAVNDKEGTKAFVTDNLHHWNAIPYMMNFGGKIFKDPPNNVTPTLDMPESVQGADYFAKLLREYSPEGVLSYTDDQAMTAQMEGRANLRTNSIDWFAPIAADPTKSKTAKLITVTELPAGPKGNFPASNSHGYGIPIGSKKKDAAWEFMKWANSKELVMRMITEKGYGSPVRLSAISSPEFKKKMQINGVDVAAIYGKILDLGGKGGFMKYRIVPVFPQVGAAINKAISAIATKQMSAEAAMKQAQQEAITDIKKAGFKIDA